MLNGNSYTDITKFILENFFLKMSKWTMYYIDSDGDSISLDSEADVQTMIETSGKNHMKVFVKDVEESEINNVEIGQKFDVDSLIEESTVSKVEQSELKCEEVKQENN